MDPHYFEWLMQQPIRPSTVQTYLSDMRRIEAAYGNVDEMTEDQVDDLLRCFSYSRTDTEAGLPNPSRFATMRPPFHKNLPPYRTTLEHYRAFQIDRKDKDQT